MMVQVKGHTYTVARKGMIKAGARYGIIGLEKKDMLEMRNDRFDLEKSFLNTKKQYELEGFKVYCYKKEEKKQ